MRQSDFDTVTAALIRLDNVTLKQADHVILRDVDWIIRPGEQWAILGPNGSGKSTLAKALAGRHPLSNGVRRYRSAGLEQSIVYVAFDGRPNSPNAFHQSRWHAGIPVDSSEVNVLLSADTIWQQNPYQVTAHRETPEDFPRLKASIVEDLRLKPILGRRIHQLSDGEWRRIQLARALLKSPQLLILDNPLSGLDVQFRERLSRMLSSLCKRDVLAKPQICVIASELSEVPDIITHVCVLARGRVLAQGPRDEVLADDEIVRTIDASTSRERAFEDDVVHSTDGPPVVEMHGVSVTHGVNRLLRNVEWTVRRGERWAVIGPNGAGKTTLLSLILGDHPQAYANDIKLFGTQRGSGESIWEIKRRIGWVAPELHRYYPATTACFDVVGSGFYDALGRGRGCTPAQETRALAWMARLGIEQEREHPLHRLSKGQQRLALIARALVKAPELLILDEPCQGLDTRHRLDVLQAVEEIIKTTETTIIYVSHRREALPRGLTHLLELNRGEVVRREALQASR